MSSVIKLFDENDSDHEDEIGVNKEYAANYETWRRKEELNKCNHLIGKARYGDIESDSSSSDDEDDDDVGILDTDFLQTLSCLKNEDPRIYDQNVKFFKDVESNSGNKRVKSKKDKSISLRQYETNVLLSTGGKIDEIEDEESQPRAESPTYVEEQRQIKESFKDILKDDCENVNRDDDGWGGLFKKRNKTKEETDQEDKDYVLWLKGQKSRLTDDKMASELKPLKEFWNDPHLNSNEKFLRDYFLNKRFLNEDGSNYIQSYEEITQESEELSEEEDTLQKQEEFETKYNYRFEEPDQEFIKRYPRTMANSVRKKDDRRKQKRTEIRERKEEMKSKKKEELNQLKAMKRKEIQEKIEQLKEITGNTDIGFNDADLEEDFDPDAYDRRMQQLFNDEFYEGAEGDQKPNFPDIDEELEIENWDKWHPNSGLESNEPHCEDEDFNMDCEATSSKNHQSEMIANSKNQKKRKKKSKFLEAVNKEKPIFDPNDKTYEEYLDEYYKLDYEDLIGDIPCRFKYRKVAPNDFGLSIEEILGAKDKELNKWCSLKKVIQIRPDHIEKYDQIAYKNKSKNDELKKKTLPSLYSNNSDDISQSVTSEIPNKRSKKRKFQSTIAIDSSHAVPVSDIGETSESPPQKLSKKPKIPNRTYENNSETSPNGDAPEELALYKNKQNNIHVGDENEESQVKGKKQKSIRKRKLNLPSDSEEKKIKLNTKTKRNRSSKDVGISDERLKAYGIKPKKFKNKLKYGVK